MGAPEPVDLGEGDVLSPPPPPPRFVSLDGCPATVGRGHAGGDRI